MKKNLRIVILILAVVLVAMIVYFINYEKKASDYTTSIISGKEDPLSSIIIQPNISLIDGRQCYAYNHEATKEEPITSNELLDITINGSKVTGVKNGTQNGPELTNGYTGTILGTLADDTITAIFSYTVESSKGKEKEIYRAAKTGIEKMRYPLIEEARVLVPDTIKDFKPLLYSRVSCEASN